MEKKEHARKDYLRLPYLRSRFYLRTWGRVKQPTVFCNNCLGGMVLHDFELRFNSPTVNLWIPEKDYLEYISNFEAYRNPKFEELETENDYPVGLMNGKIHCHFMHYTSFKEAVEAWRRRENRIDLNNAFYIFVEGDECDYNDLRRFDSLPYKHKIAVTRGTYPDIRCARNVKGFNFEPDSQSLYDWRKFTLKRVYDDIDWACFLSGKH
jgi:uncharacterized protein (DUF1919 family)